MSSLPDRHNAVSSWFLGPRGENHEYLKGLFQMALDTQLEGRKSYFPNDKPFITPDIQASSQFQDSMKQLNNIVATLSTLLTTKSIPFWSPRYNGHMNMDTTLPGIAGYITTMLFNPNNVAVEASPLTTALEVEAGRQLCRMVGIPVVKEDDSTGWGHITCGGSVANLEAIWAARNLKFYPLSLMLATENDGPLNFIREKFTLATCDGVTKRFVDFSTWELLNIAPDVVLNIPNILYDEFDVSRQFLQKAMKNYIIQSTSKDDPILAKRFERDGIRLDNMTIIASSTKHYSWPKGAAITGLGSDNLLNVEVDLDARMDMKDLDKQLEACLTQKRGIYAVVAIMGSTEHGACDPLKDIIKLREKYQKKGLSFVVHADGAWGTYYHTMLNKVVTSNGQQVESRTPSGLVPSIPLKEKTRESLEFLRECESITVDPHKSGYLQYPAGGLLYRNGRMRYLVTWTSPVIARAGEENIGVYGVEGSKPGAAAVAVWTSHQVIGLDQAGYGAILGEGVFSCVRMYAHLATMSDKDSDFRLTTLNMLPDERSGVGPEKQKEFIRKRILDVPNSELIQDTEAMQLIKDMGSDLSINTFAVNFRIGDEINTDVIEANNLNTRIFKRLSITDTFTDINTRPLILNSTELPQATYKSCLDNYKARMGLVGDQDLYTLINVISSPFPTQANFTSELAHELQKVIEEEVLISQYRNVRTKAFHGFIMQGTSSTVHLVHLPMFNMANHRFQLIITGELPADVLEKYVAARKSHKGYFTLANANADTLEDLLRNKEFEAVIDHGMPPSDGTHLFSGFKLTNVRVIHQSQLDSKYLKSWPVATMPFYVYGNQASDELHIDHALLASPNIMLSAESVKLSISLPKDLKRPMVLHLPLWESAMQPFPDNAGIAKLVEDNRFFFKAGAEFQVTLSDSVDVSKGETVQTGTLTLSSDLFVDTDMLNENPVPQRTNTGAPKIYKFKTKGGANDDQPLAQAKPQGVSKVPNAEDVENTELPLTTARKMGYIDAQSERVEVDDVPVVIDGSFYIYSKSETVSESPIIPLLKNPKSLVSEQYLALMNEAAGVGSA